MDFFSPEEAAWKLRNGAVVAYPTETVYGLGAIIHETEAVLRLKQVKGILRTKPLSVLITKNRSSMLDELVTSFCPIAQRLAKFYWPGPLTIVHEARPSVPDLITGGSGFVGIRCSPHPGLNKLLDLVGHPIITTSANLAGKPPATNYEEVFAYFADRIDGVLVFDEKQSEEKTPASNIPSTIVRVDAQKVEILREGAIKKEDLLRKIYD
ncbi:MAG TPA: L-threonylcarbamoyladenylate synthase [bacterium]|nr:L-threonylcarbamoyladenylate synthase [bacterium]